MDRITARELLLTGFKPKEKDIDTPYLGELDGQLKLVGLSGKQSIALEQQATDQKIDKEGNAIDEFNAQKFTVLAICACLRLRDTGEAVLNKADVLGERNDGNGEFLEMDSEPFKELAKAVMTFLGRRKAKEIKNGSEPTGDGSATSSSPPDSAEPSKSSSPELTPTS